MNFFAPGMREGTRRLHRLWQRARLWQYRRRLARAETDLGLLGWQQADFDPETQQQVEAIQNVEREQSRLINAAASHAATHRRLRAEYEQAQRSVQEARRELAAEEKHVREPRAELERRLAERRKTEPNFERRIPELDRELREVMRLVSELLRVEPQTPKIRQELLRARERSVSIPNEKSDLRTQHLRTVSEIRKLEDALAENLQAAAQVEERLHKLDAEGARQEEAMLALLKAEEHEKAKVEKRITELEGAKENPYQAIGKVLAETNLAPLNQPEALEKVKRFEYSIGAIRQGLLESEQRSAEEDAAALRVSLILWSLILLTSGMILYAWL